MHAEIVLGDDAEDTDHSGFFLALLSSFNPDTLSVLSLDLRPYALIKNGYRGLGTPTNLIRILEGRRRELRGRELIEFLHLKALDISVLDNQLYDYWWINKASNIPPERMSKKLVFRIEHCGKYSISKATTGS